MIAKKLTLSVAFLLFILGTINIFYENWGYSGIFYTNANIWLCAFVVLCNKTWNEKEVEEEKT